MGRGPPWHNLIPLTNSSANGIASVMPLCHGEKKSIQLQSALCAEYLVRIPWQHTDVSHVGRSQGL